LQLHLYTHKYNYIFHDSPNLSHQVLPSRLILNFVKDVMRFLFYFSKFQYTSYQPIPVTDFGWRTNYVTCLIFSCLQNLFLTFRFRKGCRQPEQQVLLSRSKPVY